MPAHWNHCCHRRHVLSDLYGNIFNGSGDYRLSAIFGIGLYLCIVIVTCTGLILNRLDKDKTNDKDDEHTDE